MHLFTAVSAAAPSTARCRCQNLQGCPPTASFEPTSTTRGASPRATYCSAPPARPRLSTAPRRARSRTGSLPLAEWTHHALLAWVLGWRICMAAILAQRHQTRSFSSSSQAEQAGSLGMSGWRAQAGGRLPARHGRPLGDDLSATPTARVRGGQQLSRRCDSLRLGPRSAARCHAPSHKRPRLEKRAGRPALRMFCKAARERSGHRLSQRTQAAAAMRSP